MASKVLVKIPVNFGAQVGKCTTADIISASVSARAATSTESTSESTASPEASSPSDSIASASYDSALRVSQLEQNIKFLKEQHHLMLTSLHHEVEALRQRNRDLQFQLVFSKGSLALVKSTPSSPEDDMKSQIALSPKQVNVSSLQVEILERDIAELRSSLSESRARNSCLENIIDEQTKQLENTTKPSPSSDDINPSMGSSDPDLAFKLEEAEKVIRRLRRENDEQRREIAMMKANHSKEQSVGASSAHHRPANHWTQPQSYEQQREYHFDHREGSHDLRTDQAEQQPDGGREGSRFPPLNNTKFWHNNGGTQRGNPRWNHSRDSSRGVAGSRMLNQSLPSIPGIPMTGNVPSTSSNPGSAPFALLSHGGGGGRRSHRGNYRGDRSGGGRGGSGSGQSGNRGQWDQTRDNRGRDRDRNREQHGFND